MSAISTDTTTLDFGVISDDPNCSDITILSTSQVYVLTCNSITESSNKQGSGAQKDGSEDNEVLKKINSYCKRFHVQGGANAGTQNNQSLVSNLDNLQSALLHLTFPNVPLPLSQSLHQFEVAQLMNLLSLNSTVEEVESLIPSIRRIGREGVETVLEMVRRSLERLMG